MTSHTHFSWNCMNEWTKGRYEVVVTSYGRNKNRDDEMKKHSWTSPDVQFKEFSLTKQKKLDQERTMNGLGKPFRKKSDPKNRKNSKNHSYIAACEQETTTEKPNFCSNTIFALYFKLRAKKFTPQNHSLFCSISCFGVTKITTPIWVQNSWKCVDRS